ncbi:hypothetical protein M378DRAFT_174076, partial [Amanita muscaria Koide BX008]
MLITHNPAKEHDFWGGLQARWRLATISACAFAWFNNSDATARAREEAEAAVAKEGKLTRARRVQHEEQGKGKIEKRRRRQLTLRGTSRHRPEQSCGMCCALPLL